MDRRTELLTRVREDAEAVEDIFSGGSNVPLGEYVDTPSLNALCDSLKLEPEAWQASDLEKSSSFGMVYIRFATSFAM